MSAVKLHLEQAEYDALLRYAEALGVSPEDVAYAALNRLMLQGRSTEVNLDIVETREWRRHNLPLWSDSACSVHAYEGKADDEPAQSRRA
jgi:pyrroloquinoline quinone (PQQ) biosynthesis protein C